MKPPAGAALISLRTEDRPDLELCIAAARPAQKVADRNASQQSEPVLLDDVLTMPALRGPVPSKPSYAKQIQRPSGRTVLLKPSNLFEYPRSSGGHYLMHNQGVKPGPQFIEHFN